jgi:hypothetical protein
MLFKGLVKPTTTTTTTIPTPIAIDDATIEEFFI